MTTYPLHSRVRDVALAVLAVGAVAIVFIVAIIPELRDTSPPQETPLRPFVASGAIVLLLILALGLAALALRQVYAIAVAADGTIELRRTLGRTRIAARDVRALVGSYSASYNGNQSWVFTLRASQGTFTFGEFDNAMRFMEQVRELNPAVSVAGLWPMGLPWGPTSSRHLL